MSRVLRSVSTPPQRFPRVSGDEPALMAHLDMVTWFSPRERG